MKPRVLFIITSDPRTSPRPAEAVRIAAGVGVWEKMEIAVYVRGEAVRALGESEEGLVDEDNFAQYWPMLAKAASPIYAQKNADPLAQLAPTRAPFTEITDDQLAALAAKQTYVISF
jgi:hypothetical protein